ncbi:MAG TPA: hydrogenase nickel incorporation protein HypA [Elusimicrobiales bacterium]|jgi:hydrogenase nickel incorporation protein HypA/HybF|nr:hydrogenase nickel incorporation protein HypA [Elusimicrobiales bacterium]HOL61812.1 hydrogenase nickel incorporation protein HypA [Elusimicrobiales bacterium]HPO94606.1 hydrogenase nickel incorporation protein HypA [Elusimicrobiales bacterium]
MHEWALAESVIKTINEKKEFVGKKVIVYMGELQAIDMEVFKFAMEEILKQNKKKINYKIVVEESEFKCNSCGKDFSMSEVKKKSEEEKENIHFIPEMVKAFVKCPKCKSIDFEIIKGRGVSLGYE